jgi:hypothetical protein
MNDPKLTKYNFIETYTAAVAISCSTAVGLGQVVKNATSFSPTTRLLIQKVRNFNFVIFKLQQF